MIRNYWNEKWKEIKFDDKISTDEKYKISDRGRIANCKGDQEKIVKVTYINGYQNLPLKQEVNKKLTSRYVHKLMAEHFLERNDGEYVIHLNYDKKDNSLENLQWATKKQKEEHQFKNPEYQDPAKRRRNSKLSEAKVRLIKKKINDPNRRTRMKMIAKQFGISEMQLYRIKSGENWGSVE